MANKDNNTKHNPSQTFLPTKVIDSSNNRTISLTLTITEMNSSQRIKIQEITSKNQNRRRRKKKNKHNLRLIREFIGNKKEILHSKIHFMMLQYSIIQKQYSVMALSLFIILIEEGVIRLKGI